MERKHEKYERLLARCKALPPVPTAVAHPCDRSSLEGAVGAAERGLIVPILVGPVRKIEAVAAEAGIDLAHYEVIDAPHSNAAAEAAVRVVREGRAEMLMKGSLHTDELLGARVPIVLTSRADTVMSRLASCAIALLVASFRRQTAAVAD